MVLWKKFMEQAFFLFRNYVLNLMNLYHLYKIEEYENSLRIQSRIIRFNSNIIIFV